MNHLNSPLSAMDREASCDLDEFFDFARLEADSNGCKSLHPESSGDCLACPGVSGSETFAPDMEWEASAEPEAIHRSAAIQVHDDWHVPHHVPDINTGNGGLHELVDSQSPHRPTQELALPLDACSNLSYPATGETNPTYHVAGNTPRPITAAPSLAHTNRGPLTGQQPHEQLRRSLSVQRKPACAKYKGSSNRLPLETKQMLEEEFATNPYPCSWEIDIIAHQVNLDAKRVRNWFNNARARKMPPGTNEPPAKRPGSARSIASKLSVDSLEALSKRIEDASAPQPPLAAYLASSYLEEAADLSDIQAAMSTVPSSERDSVLLESSSGSRAGRSGSVITSLTSSEGSAPTSYAVSSGGSNTSSFGRERRRGRRRASWRNSPYARPRLDNLNDAGLPSPNLPFFCTFCPRAFKTKYEWVRHEDSVHALRTTWICCSTRQVKIGICPFCGISDPDEVHLAGHKYQQCRNKPEVQRTFYRRDHFIQHLHHVHFSNEKHPSPHLGCGTRKTTKGQKDWGCKELAMKWRRFGAPMKRDDPMLHCGFCGKTLKDWNTRCDHIAEHFLGGGWNRSGWWAERKETHMDNLCVPGTTGAVRCRYCQKVFENTGAMKGHSTCRVWSCRLLRTFDDVASDNAGPPLCPQFPSPKARHCHLCGRGYRVDHVEHAQQYHRYRHCSQEFYTSKEDFLHHLHVSHGASHPLLLMQNAVLDQHFSRTKGASFEPVELDEILQGCRVATPEETFIDPLTSRSRASLTFQQSMSWAKAPTSAPSRMSSQASETASISTTATEQALAEPRAHKGRKYYGPRIFRLDPLVPFLSSKIYFLRNARMGDLEEDGKALLKEVEKNHVASLVMMSGLVGMAGVRMPVALKRDERRGVVEMGLDE